MILIVIRASFKCQCASCTALPRPAIAIGKEREGKGRRQDGRVGGRDRKDGEGGEERDEIRTLHCFFYKSNTGCHTSIRKSPGVNLPHEFQFMVNKCECMLFILLDPL